jgi:hypothetical protein
VTRGADPRGSGVTATAVSVTSTHTSTLRHGSVDAAMSAFQSPLVRYGIALPSAAVAVAIGFLVFDGTARLVVFGIAALELVAVPWILANAE